MHRAGVTGEARGRVSVPAGGLPPVPDSFAWRGEAGPVWLEAAVGGARAGFTTRLGGVSDGPYRSLNLGILTDDDPTRVARNRDLVADALGRDPAGFAMGWQVHGADLQVHDAKPSRSGWSHRGTLEKRDGQIATRPDVTPLVLAADCAPLVIAGEDAVAVVHCGWRGIAAGIVPRAVETVVRLGASSAGALHSALGPAIGPCCYGVGDEVLAALRERGHASKARRRDRFLDLPLAVRFELERAGVERSRIADPALCTSCHETLFFSHRRDAGVTGRQAGIAWLER